MRKLCSAGLMFPAALVLLLPGPQAQAQAVETASRDLGISVFGGLSGNFTGLAGGRNLDVTAGADLSFRPRYSVYPSIEVRGSYPVDGGNVDAQKNVLGGVKLSPHFGRLRPYGDVLFGRGAINYEQRFSTPDPHFYYIRSVSNVLAAGAGLDLEMSRHLLFKADWQLERYATPATLSGHLYSQPITLGAVYRFSFGK